jgi:histidine ammonia-lyase
MNDRKTLRLGDPQQPLSIAQLELIASGSLRLELVPEVRPKVDRAQEFVQTILASGESVYGINTGFGRLASERISNEQVVQLQKNLVRSHACGVGDPLPVETVRALVALRLNSLLQGNSGIRYELLDSMMALLEHDVIPFVPSRGSVGASGDLAPLAHVALVLMGEGEVNYRGQRRPTAEVFRELNIAPYEFGAKEALATINGTQLICSVGALALARFGRLLKMADIVAGMTLEALLGTDSACHEAIQAVRPHPGQVASATNVRKCLANSALIASHRNCSKVQDPYSLRCIPQVHGAARDSHRFATDILEREMNSVTDNPLVFPELGKILSGGNFHGAPAALALDTAAIGLSYISNISERRCDRLLNPDTNDDLPPFLARGHGLNSGLMIVQYVAAALASEGKILTHPASSDSIPTSGGYEDHVSMGPAAAYKLERLLGLVEQVLACEWVCASEALEHFRDLTFGPATEAAYALLRTKVAPLQDDRPFYQELAHAKEWVTSGELLKAVTEAVGELI